MEEQLSYGDTADRNSQSKLEVQHSYGGTADVKIMKHLKESDKSKFDPFNTNKSEYRKEISEFKSEIV